MKSNSSKLLNVSDCYDRKPSSHQQVIYISVVGSWSRRTGIEKSFFEIILKNLKI